jgi:hypothetical protein
MYAHLLSWSLAFLPNSEWRVAMIFTSKQVDVGRSLAADRRSRSKTVAKPGQGDRGDRRPAPR